MISNWLNKRNISKWKFIDWIPDYKAKTARGNGWISFFQTFIPLQYIIPLLGLKLALVDKYPIWILAIGGIIYSIGFEVIKYTIGHFDKKHGVWERESVYNQTQKELSPFNHWLIGILKKICEKLDIKFEDLK